MAKGEVMKPNVLKALMQEKSDLIVYLEELHKRRDYIAEEIKKAQKKVESINHRIENQQGRGLLVTEHALLRYIERELDIDLEEITKIIRTKIDSYGMDGLPGRYALSGKTKAVVKNNTVITIAKR